MFNFFKFHITSEVISRWNLARYFWNIRLSLFIIRKWNLIGGWMFFWIFWLLICWWAIIKGGDDHFHPVWYRSVNVKDLLLSVQLICANDYISASMLQSLTSSNGTRTKSQAINRGKNSNNMFFFALFIAKLGMVFDHGEKNETTKNTLVAFLMPELSKLTACWRLFCLFICGDPISV